MLKNEWTTLLEPEFNKPYFKRLSNSLQKAYENTVVYPPASTLFSAFEYTDYPDVKVVIIGQDPYHQANQAHGMSFSVLPGVKIPPSLQNIFKELHGDIGCPIPKQGCLMDWAKQGVLLLNTVLSVEQSKPLSHHDIGWELFTDEVMRLLNKHPQPLVFILWGKAAQSKARWITESKHCLLTSVHPSPLSVYRGFFGSKPFSKANAFLVKNNRIPIAWEIKDDKNV